MFHVSVQNDCLKGALEALILSVFGEEACCDEKASIIITDDQFYKPYATQNKLSLLILCSPDFDGGARLPEGAEYSILPVKPSQFIRQCIQLYQKEAVPEIKKTIQIQPFMFKPHEFLLLDEARNKEIILTEKERNILLLLHEAGFDPVSKDEMLKKIWNYAPNIETHTLETHIYRLRQKIEADPSDPQILITDEKGYRLSC